MALLQHEKDTSVSDHVLQTPVWMLVIRVFQILISLIIVGLAGRLMHDAYLDEEGLALAIALFTWIIVGYIVLTEKIPALRKAYHIIAVLVLDGLMVILWLATFAAVAAERARYVVNVQTYGCFDDGSTFDSKTCLTRRGVLLFKSGAAMLAAIAGIGAILWLLFIATFVWTVVMYLRGRKDGRFLVVVNHSEHGDTGDANNTHQMESKPLQQPVVTEQQQQQQQYPVQAQHTGQQYPPQDQGYYPPPAGTYAPQQYTGHSPVSPQSVSPAPQQASYPPGQELYAQQQQQQQQQPYHNSQPHELQHLQQYQQPHELPQQHQTQQSQHGYYPSPSPQQHIGSELPAQPIRSPSPV